MIASFRELNPLKERLSGNIDKLLRFRTDDANRMGSGCIRMISFVDNTRIQADDIAFPDNMVLVRDTVYHFIIH